MNGSRPFARSDGDDSPRELAVIYILLGRRLRRAELASPENQRYSKPSRPLCNRRSVSQGACLVAALSAVIAGSSGPRATHTLLKVAEPCRKLQQKK